MRSAAQRHKTCTCYSFLRANELSRPISAWWSWYETTNIIAHCVTYYMIFVETYMFTDQQVHFIAHDTPGSSGDPGEDRERQVCHFGWRRLNDGMQTSAQSCDLTSTTFSCPAKTFQLLWAGDGIFHAGMLVRCAVHALKLVEQHDHWCQQAVWQDSCGMTPERSVVAVGVCLAELTYTPSWGWMSWWHKFQANHRKWHARTSWIYAEDDNRCKLIKLINTTHWAIIIRDCFRMRYWLLLPFTFYSDHTRLIVMVSGTMHCR